VKIIDVDNLYHRTQNLYMVIRLTGSQLHAARVLAGISRETLAERAGLCRHTVLAWEHSSHSLPNATYGDLLRAVSVLARG
jgi:transcriptional regulator with XRE-family HTH domain